ncbi:hypothetical protein [uncultured Duncaniella sp.]|uniref:hypothetical protein n=1 Tax=uncultured Duncaniella sp. TaxID=2768039 RepID=UPI0025A944BC|nr:hypothetical protein [uncultured Duncaniella sp.]
MTESLLEELMRVPLNATSATIQGIQMQVIDEYQARAMLNSDINDDFIHECILANGHFLFEMVEGTLKTLFKVHC